MNLSEEDIDSCQKAFMDIDEDGKGAIKSGDLGIALERIGIQLGEKELYKLIYEVDQKGTGMIKFSDFLTIYFKFKYANLHDDDQDTLDAFVAMGGNEDKSGHVNAHQLIQIVKQEFQMTIDIEKLIAEIDSDGSGLIEYNEFKMLLKTAHGQQ